MQHPIQRFENRFNAPSQAGAAQRHIPRRVQAIKHLAAWKQQGDDQPDWWLRQLIGGGFQQLVALALPGAPAVEMLPTTAEMWLLIMADMELVEEIDQPRIAKAFKLLFVTLKEWPQLADLIAKLPPRPQQTAAPAPRTEQQHADGAARLKDILDGLGKEQEDGNDSA